MRRLWQWLWRSSVRRQLIVGVALVHLLLMTIFVLDLVHRQREFLIGQARSRVTVQAELLASSSIQGVMSADLSGLSENVGVLAKDKDVSRAMITDASGRVLADMKGANLGRFRNDQRTLAVLGGAPQPLLVDESRESVEAAAPVTVKGRVLGWAWVARDLRPEQAHLAYVTYAGLIYTGVAILIGTLFAFFLAARVTRQLRLLLEGTARLGANQLAQPVPVTTENEVGQVARSFNEAMHRLSDQQQALQASKATLEEADRRRTEFLSMLSHELRNPLAAISNVVFLLNRDPAQSSQTRALHEILQRQTRHLARMVDDLLDVARITRGRIQIHKETVRLDELVRHTAADARSTIDAKAHRLVVNAAGDIQVEGDEARLKQVVANLIENAAKYTDPGGAIAVEVTREGDQAVIRVRDNGTGIDSALLPHVFELFTQGPRSLDRSEGGLGIGLALVKQLVEMHGGQVGVDSDVGRGSEFVVRLPLAATAVSARSESTAGAAASGLRILIVEDNRDAASSLAALLQGAGNETEIAHDGPQGVDKAMQWRPDAILLDIGLPKMSGHEVCQAIRREAWGPAISIIAVTGWGQEDDFQKSQEAGFDGHLVKPVDPAAMLRLLAEIRLRRIEALPNG